MTKRSIGLHLARLATVGSLVGACSLTLPAEQDFFGAESLGGQAPEAGSAGTETTDDIVSAGAGGSAASLPVGGAAGGGSGGVPAASVGMAGAGGEGDVPIALPPAVLLIHYTFDDLSSFTAEDSSGNGMDGALTGISLPAGGPGHIDGAIQLVATQKQYVQLPGDILEKLGAISVASWLKLQSGSAWDRLFDFNAGESSWLFFSPTGWNFTTMTVGTHAAVRGMGRIDPDMQLTEAYPISAWHHIALVLAPPYLRYYLDGTLKMELTNMTLQPRDVGKTNQNWIGRSVYPSDPYLDGWVDDFRVYSGALTAAEIEELAVQ